MLACSGVWWGGGEKRGVGQAGYVVVVWEVEKSVVIVMCCVVALRVEEFGYSGGLCCRTVGR